MQDWQRTDEVARVEIDGLEKTGLEIDGLENDGVSECVGFNVPLDT